MDFTRIFDILDYQNKRFFRKDSLANTASKGDCEVIDTEKAVFERDCLSAGLLQHGFHKGAKIGIMAHCGSIQWILADLAMQQIGIIPVPIHSTARPDEIRHIINDAELSACFVSNAEMRDRFLQSGIPVKRLFSFTELSETTSWNTLCCIPDQHDLDKISYYRDLIIPTDLSTIIYTSGTTGLPKGVMLTHYNIVSNIKSVLAIVPVNHSTTVVSFLPLSHIFERMVCYSYLAAGAGIWFAPSLESLPHILRRVRPHFFTAVPRVLERTYERLLERRDRSGFFQKKIINWAMRLGEQYPFAGGDAMPVSYWFQWIVADWLVYRSWRKAMGGRIRGIAVGAAALQPRLGRLFSAAGIEVREGYGLTETSPVITFNRFEPGGVHFGTVGIPAPGIAVRIAAPNEQGEGEIEVQGPNVMSGYLNLPEETKERFTEDGWFKTGDRGKFEHKRFLRITGRISEIFKTTSGKFVAPAYIEQQLRISPFIDLVFVAGLNKPYVSALIIPDFNYLERWCKENRIHWTAPEYMILNHKVEKKIKEELDSINSSILEHHEQVKKFKLLADSWTAENGLLTPSLKLRRQAILEKYASDIQTL